MKFPDRVAMYNSTHVATIPAHVGFVPRRDYAPRATCGDDARVLFNNFLHPISGKSHQERLESFYAGQAQSYDAFRHRFLHGRVPMIEAMPSQKGGVWVDLGGGTAANLQHLGGAIDVFSKVVVLDLCRPLLDVAKERIAAEGWSNVSAIEGDATRADVKGLPKAGSVDLVTMSYSLTMIPDWRAALDNVSKRAHKRARAARAHPPPSRAQAYSLLKPGGYFAISDFTVTPEHNVLTRTLWPAIFSNDGVRPTVEHIPALRALFREVHCTVDKGGFPYIPLLKAPYYFFVGQKAF